MSQMFCRRRRQLQRHAHGHGHGHGHGMSMAMSMGMVATLGASTTSGFGASARNCHSTAAIAAVAPNELRWVEFMRASRLSARVRHMAILQLLARVRHPLRRPSVCDSTCRPRQLKTGVLRLQLQHGTRVSCP